VKPPEPLQEQHLKSNLQVILKNDESITNIPINNPTKYDGIANILTRKPYKI